MNSDPSQNKIKDLKFYIPEAFRFYSIKNEYLTPILFVLALIILFGGEYIPLPGALRIIGSFFIYFRLILVNIIFLMYLSAYLKDLNGEKYTLKEIIFPDRKKLSNIITLAVINLVLSLASISIIFFIPALIVYLTTIFCSCYVFDKNISIIEAIFESKNATGGHKIQLLGLMVKLLFPITVILLLSLMLAGSSNKLLIFPFVLSFSYSIAMLMFQRIVALLYYSFEDSGMDNEC